MSSEEIEKETNKYCLENYSRATKQYQKLCQKYKLGLPGDSVFDCVEQAFERLILENEILKDLLRSK